MSEHEFKVGDEVEVVSTTDCSREFKVGSVFEISHFDCDGDARDIDGDWCNPSCLKLIEPAPEVKTYWDGKEELRVGMWGMNFDKEVKVEMIDADNVGFYLSGVITVGFIESIKPINTHKQKWIADYTDAFMEQGAELNDVLSEVYDKAREGV